MPSAVAEGDSIVRTATEDFNYPNGTVISAETLRQIQAGTQISILRYVPFDVTTIDGRLQASDIMVDGRFNSVVFAPRAIPPDRLRRTRMIDARILNVLEELPDKPDQ